MAVDYRHFDLIDSNILMINNDVLIIFKMRNTLVIMLQSLSVHAYSYPTDQLG